MIVVEGYVTQYSMDVERQDVYEFGRLETRNSIITGRTLTLTLKLLDWDEAFYRMLGSGRIRFMVDDGSQPLNLKEFEPGPKPKNPKNPKRLIIQDKTWR